jgi:hypothetical protein
MNDKNAARAGRYVGVKHFKGCLFATVDPIELTPPELGPLFSAANENYWGYVQPVIFGTLFEGSLSREERHALDAHLTSWTWPSAFKRAGDGQDLLLLRG